MTECFESRVLSSLNTNLRFQGHDVLPNSQASSWNSEVCGNGRSTAGRPYQFSVSLRLCASHI
jgi:hypothetical protein